MAVSSHGRGADQVSLRLPDGMRDRIKAAAEENGRSMNSEIIATLNEAYPPQASFDELAAEIRGLLEEMPSGGIQFAALRKALDEVHLALEEMYQSDAAAAADYVPDPHETD